MEPSLQRQLEREAVSRRQATEEAEREELRALAERYSAVQAGRGEVQQVRVKSEDAGQVRVKREENEGERGELSALIERYTAVQAGRSGAPAQEGAHTRETETVTFKADPYEEGASPLSMC